MYETIQSPTSLVEEGFCLSTMLPVAIPACIDDVTAPRRDFHSLNNLKEYSNISETLKIVALAFAIFFLVASDQFP
jgi:hypothetical protein